QPLGGKLVRSNGRPVGEGPQVTHVDRAELDPERVAEAAPVRQLADQRQLAAFEVGWHAPAGSGVLPLVPLARRFDLAAAVAAADALGNAGGAGGRLQIVQTHALSPPGSEPGAGRVPPC